MPGIVDIITTPAVENSIAVIAGIATVLGTIATFAEKMGKRKEKAPLIPHAPLTTEPVKSAYLEPCTKFADAVSDWFYVRFKKFEEFAKNDALCDSNLELQQSLLDQIALAVPGFPGGIYVIKDAKVSNQHTPLAPDVPNITGYVVSSRPYYDECKTKLKSIASDVFLSANRNVEILVVATPIFNKKGYFVGILDGVIDIVRAPFSNMAKQTILDFRLSVSHPKVRLILIDERKVVIGASHGEVDGKSNVSSDPSVARLLASLSQDQFFVGCDGAVSRVEGTGYFAICYDAQ